MLSFVFQRGPNKVPVYALFVITVISLIFVFIGRVNTLGPIVTMPFMLTYAAVDYAYFALAMSFDKRNRREARFREAGDARDLPPTFDKTALNGGLSPTPVVSAHTYGSIPGKQGQPDDLDNLFPERHHQDGRGVHRPINKGSPEQTPDTDIGIKSETTSMASEADQTAGLLGDKDRESIILT